jgi:hypothetical protein
MEQIYYQEKELTFSDLIPSTNDLETPAWRIKCSTKIAHPSGRTPSLSTAAGWQPLYSPGKSNYRKPESTTISGLIRRVRLSRGEA